MASLSLNSPNDPVLFSDVATPIDSLYKSNPHLMSLVQSSCYMEIPLLLSGANRFLHLNVLHRLLQFSELRDLWTWAALLLAGLATFVSVSRRAGIVIFRPRWGKSDISDTSVHYSSDDDDDDDEGDEDEEEEEEAAELLLSDDGGDERAGDLCDYEDEQGQNGRTGEGFFWPGLLGGGVVKVWDEIGLDFARPSGIVSLLDLNRWEVFRSLPTGYGQIPAVFMPDPSVLASAAAVERDGAIAMKAWDVRIPGQTAAAAAEWRPMRPKVVVGITGGAEGSGVYIRDGVGTVTEVDLRKSRTPVEETWWDAEP